MKKTDACLIIALGFFLVGFTGCAVLKPCGGGCGSHIDCGCDVECGCDVGCGCEPGCSVDCCDTCTSGRSYAGQRWIGGPCKGIEFNFCEDCNGCGCETSCGCESSCECEVSCGCEPACDCGTECGCGDIACCDTCGPEGCGLGIASNVAYGARCIVSEVGRVFTPVCRVFGCGGCSGCDSELYWNEWHNDPPCCHDPCDECGNWVGPSH